MAEYDLREESTSGDEGLDTLIEAIRKDGLPYYIVTLNLEGNLIVATTLGPEVREFVVSVAMGAAEMFSCYSKVQCKDMN